jgi:hypothetical protein
VCLEPNPALALLTLFVIHQLGLLTAQHPPPPEQTEKIVFVIEQRQSGIPARRGLSVLRRRNQGATSSRMSLLVTNISVQKLHNHQTKNSKIHPK